MLLLQLKLKRSIQDSPVALILAALELGGTNLSLRQLEVRIRRETFVSFCPSIIFYPTPPLLLFTCRS